MPTRRRFLSLASMAAGMGLLAACGPAAPAPAPTSPPAAPKPTTAPAAAPTTDPAAAAKPTTAPAAAPTTAPATKPGATAANTLTFLWGSDTNRLDPPAMDAQEGFIATTAMYEGLVKYKSGGTDVEPLLAEKWDISADGKEYIFHLKPGVKFHDGSAMNAEAVAFTFDRMVNKDNPLYKDAQGDYGGFPYVGDYISNVVTKADSLVSGMSSGTGTMHKLFTDQQLYDELVKTVTELNKVLVDVRRDPRRYTPGMIKVF